MGMNDVYGKYDDKIGQMEVELWDGKKDSLKKILPNFKEKDLNLSTDDVPRAKGSLIQTRAL
jgi:hypothetical protein